MSKADLRIDWATHEAAKFACEHWHYSGCMPAGKLVKVGAWEFDRFIGVVLFGRGANNNIGKPYQLEQTECCELVRIALTTHKTPVTRIVSMALRFLNQQSAGLRLVVSYADPLQGHHGGIYQGGNWVYVGTTKGGTAQLIMSNGKTIHKRTAKSIFGSCSAKRIGALWTPEKQKHKYLMPLDTEMRKRIMPLSKPYPKRASSETSDTAGSQPEKGGATPTDALQLSGE